jgi:hypothetical protein
MAIKITQPGEAKAAAATGVAIGKGKRAEEDRARAEREQVRAQQAAAQQAARQAALEWEQQKMLINSQQDFAHEIRMRQADLDKEARAREWMTEKMEMASRLDFEQDEKERQRNNAEYAAGRDTLDKKKEEMPAGEYERALFRLDSIYAPKGVSAAVEGLGYKEQTGGLFNLGEETPPPSGVSTVDNPLGLNIESIPVSQLPQAVLDLEAQNKFEVISPDGDKETIDAVQWPGKKAQGYVLAQIRKQKLKQESVYLPNPYLSLGKARTPAQKSLTDRLKRSILGPGYRGRVTDKSTSYGATGSW